ncbi:MAG: right-handed parallel beta-helix repeat-containing protein [Candidatus Heimdallarchaeaceae archaeon]
MLKLKRKGKKDKRKVIVLVTLVCMLGIFLTYGERDLIVASNQYAKENLVCSAPILIENDAGFSFYDFPGSGTVEDPYRIENLLIETNEEYGIYITTTSLYFIINNCTICSEENGIRIDHVKRNTSRITNNTCNSRKGIYVTRAENSTIMNNFCSVFGVAIKLINSPNSTIYGNLCWGGGIIADYSCSSIVANNSCEYNGQGDGIVVRYSSLNVIVNNTVSRTSTAMYFDSLTKSLVQNNLCYENKHGIDGFNLSSCNITKNILVHNREGILVTASCSNLIISYNIFIYNSIINGISYAQARDDGINSTWYDKEAKRGNYWTDYNKTTGYYIIPGYANSIDLYPLTEEDEDNDTLDNYLERYFYFTDPYNNDTDGDLLLDGEEVLVYLTDPLKKDSDGDGLKDGEEVYIYHTDPLAPDTDLDGLLDGKEIFIFGTNATNKDTDDDLIPDGWEVANGLNPLVNDSYLDQDNDTLSNLEEYQYNSNPFSYDSDNDGLSDGEEVKKYNTNPNNPDTDNDDLTDGEEIQVYFSDPLDRDTDDDGLLDGEEVKKYLTDPLNKDTDNDTMPDGWEVANGLNPIVKDGGEDPDEDKLVNKKEYEHFTDPHDPDTDGDGFKDGYEVRNEKDPLDPLDHPWRKKVIINIMVSTGVGTIAITSIISNRIMRKREGKKRN